MIFIVNFSPALIVNSAAQEKDESLVSVVIIDPGHGGKDWGASMGNAKEKDIVLDIALKLGDIIKTNYSNVKIVYTRKKDIFVPLHQRASIANKNKADLFISIHVNSVDNKSVKGAETYVLGQHRSKDNLDVAKKENAVILLEDDYTKTYEGFNPNSPESYIMFELVQDEYLEQSVMFASSIQKQFKEKSHRADRSVKQAGFLVLRRTTMPSVLIEAGFLSHTSERNYLLSESGKINLASAIFAAFKEYKRKIEDKSSFNLVTSKDIKIEDKQPEVTLKKKAKLQENIKKTKYFSVQVIALKRKLKTTPNNFKGVENIFIVESEDINRYYSGKFKTIYEAEKEKSRLKTKYPTAFIVEFDDN
ncbi:MAG: N-acetylmuramoyl-L-alanine amidase [Draconibacterium sp.]|nr:N-acetylmuramoyl-L-alanine amidase [Draconibacterium sp.]